MEAHDSLVGDEACSVHPDRDAEARCQECGRPSCISCAVPVRGRVLCTECATREVGIPTPLLPTEQRRAFKAPHIVAAALFAVGLLATLPPWDRFGIFTSILSAWRPEPEPWPLVASISVLVGTLAGLAFLLPRARRLTRYSSAAYTILGIVAGAASARALFGAPSYVIHTPAPYLVLGVSVAVLAMGIVMMRLRIS